MASLQELAQDYVRRLRDANDEAAEVRTIAGEINKLSYTETGEPISSDDKSELIGKIQLEFSSSKRSEGIVGIVKEADNKRYLALVQSLRALTKANL